MITLYESVESYLKAEKPAAAFMSEIAGRVSEILAEVKKRGDAAVAEFTHRFDQVEVSQARVQPNELARAAKECEPQVKQMFETAIAQVREFHQRQAPKSWREEKGGCLFGMQYHALNSVGVYVPGGMAAYPSTVIMSVAPAQIAGVRRIALVSPPNRDGQVNKLVLAVAHLLGIDEVYAVGGAQAIAALAFGTERIAAVDKIVGPGNSYVNEAKRQVFGIVGIDSLAGPTELVVLCDDTAEPTHVARDLFAQAEHDTDTRVVCVTTSSGLAHEVQKAVAKLLPASKRLDILQPAISNYGAIVVAKDERAANSLVNHIAPEHLQIITRDPHQHLDQITTAGAIFLGPNTPSVLGDYCAGPNHVLPTGRSARFSSPLSVMDFMKFSSVMECEPAAFQKYALLAAQFAELEGLDNHKQAIACRQ